MKYAERQEARKRMPSMPGWSVHWACSRLECSHALLAGNGKDLVTFLQNAPALQTPALPGKTLRKQLMPIQLEACRLLHNFVAAAKTLVDHSRYASEHLLSADASAPYTEKVRICIQECPEHVFIQSLRNYFLHVSSPLIAIRVEILSGATGFSLVRRRLLEHDKWPAVTRTFLESSTEDIQICPLASSYQAAALEVTASLLQAILDAHEGELRELYQLNDSVLEALEAEGLSADDPLIERFGAEPANKRLQPDGRQPSASGHR